MIDSASNGKEFSFGGFHISCMISWFSNDFLTSADVRDSGGYIVFDAYICYNEHNVLLYEWLFVDVV